MNFTRKIEIFWLIFAIAAIGLPGINLVNREASRATSLKARSYSIDAFRPALSRAMFKLGLSANSNQVIVGRDGWLFLGDEYAQSVTHRRIGPTNQDAFIGSALGGAIARWDLWFKENGVSQFKFAVFPDKETVYPEKLPRWARVQSTSPTPTLIQSIPPDLLIDLTAPLRREAASSPVPIYFATDSHLNDLGAWMAFQALTRRWAGSDRTIPGDMVKVVGTGTSSGDLANLLYLRPWLTSTDVVLSMSGAGAETFISNFSTGQPIPVDFFGSLPAVNRGIPELPATSFPMLVVSPSALNDKRVLWLRDSTGSAITPYMAATYKNILQIHYEFVSTKLIMNMVRDFKPDYVFFTVVERALRHKTLRLAPELAEGIEP